VSDKIEGEVLDEFHINDEQFVIKIKKSPLNKCPRCWRYLVKDGEVCDRCSEVVGG
jgi:isoleucyl-tRNA synthetase